MKKYFFLIGVLICFCVNNVFSQSGTFNFTSNTTNSGATVTQTVSGVTLTISANNGGNMDLVDATIDFGLPVTTTPPQAIEMTSLSSAITLSFNASVNITTLHCFDGTNNNTHYWDFTPTGGSNSAVLNQQINGAAGSTITLNWIGITQIRVTINGGGILAYPGFDDIVMNAALPVELTSFTVQQNGNMVTLNWSTATEVKNYGFEVEKTSPRPSPFQGEGVPIDWDGRGWDKIGFVQGNGNSNSPKSYSFVDKTISTGRYSYRLKQIDFDGQFEYSSVVDVQVDAPLAFALKQNYPNPFNPNTIIGYQLPSASHVALKVYDILGNEVAVLVNGLQAAGSYDIPFSGERLNSGIYFYKLQTSDGFTAIKKLMLVK